MRRDARYCGSASRLFIGHVDAFDGGFCLCCLVRLGRDERRYRPWPADRTNKAVRSSRSSCRFTRRGLLASRLRETSSGRSVRRPQNLAISRSTNASSIAPRWHDSNDLEGDIYINAAATRSRLQRPVRPVDQSYSVIFASDRSALAVTRRGDRCRGSRPTDNPKDCGQDRCSAFPFILNSRAAGLIIGVNTI